MAGRVAVQSPQDDTAYIIPNHDGSINVNTLNQSVGAASGTTGQVTITGSATQIVAARTGVPGTGRLAVIITNTGATDVYIGFTAGVTIATGDLLAGTKGAFVSIPYDGAVWGITGGSSQTVTYMEVY